MSEETPEAVAEYVDANGNTWQLNEADAKRLGYAKVETKVETVETGPKPPAKRAASTKAATK